MHDSAVSYSCSVLSDTNAKISPSCEKLSRAKLLPVLSASLIESSPIDPDDPPDARRVKLVNEFLLSSLLLLFLLLEDDGEGFCSFHFHLM